MKIIKPDVQFITPIDGDHSDTAGTMWPCLLQVRG